MRSICSLYSHPSDAVCLCLRCRGVLEPHPRVLGFSRQCLVLEHVLVVLIRGGKVRNDLCHHLGNGTLLKPIYLVLLSSNQHCHP